MGLENLVAPAIAGPAVKQCDQSYVKFLPITAILLI